MTKCSIGWRRFRLASSRDAIVFNRSVDTVTNLHAFSRNGFRAAPGSGARTLARGVALGVLLLMSGTAWAEPDAAATRPQAVPAAQTPVTPSGSGLPVPRFVSLKSDRVNLRAGPSTEYPTGWVFRRAGLPLEVIKEFESWRQVRDAEGATGWVLQSLLSGRRTGLVLPWEIKSGQKAPQVPIRANDSESAGVVINVEAGVIANLHSCDGRWCRVSVDTYAGYIEQKKLWGVYEGETIK